MDTHAFTPLLQHRHSRLIAKDPWMLVDLFKLSIINRLHPPGDTFNPLRHGSPVDVDAMASQHLHLPV